MQKYNKCKKCIRNKHHISTVKFSDKYVYKNNNRNNATLPVFLDSTKTCTIKFLMTIIHTRGNAEYPVCGNHPVLLQKESRRFEWIPDFRRVGQNFGL